jgi:hypothetical protein
VKVDNETMSVVVDEELEDITIDQLAADLPGRLLPLLAHACAYVEKRGRLVRGYEWGKGVRWYSTTVSLPRLSDRAEFSPRYVLYSYCYSHPDGRVSYPLLFIAYCPSGASQSLTHTHTHNADGHRCQARAEHDLRRHQASPGGGRAGHQGA